MPYHTGLIALVVLPLQINAKIGEIDTFQTT